MTDGQPRKKRSYRIVHSPPRGDQRALRHGAKARLPVGDLAKARADAREWIMELAPVREKDGSVPKEYEPAIEVMALPLSRLRHMAEWLETHEGAPGNFRLVREMRRLEAHVWRMLGSFGMTPSSKANLGLTLSAADAIQRIEPRRDVPHLQKVARVMAISGMLPSPSPDVMEGEGEVVQDEPNQSGGLK